MRDKTLKEKIEEETGVITVIDEPTYVEDMQALLAPYAERAKKKQKTKDKRYVVKKIYEALMNKKPAKKSKKKKTCSLCGKDVSKWNLDFNREIICDDCVQKGLVSVGNLERLLNTQFRNTRDLNRKVRDYLKNYKIRKGTPGERIKKARKKKGWTQREMANHLGYKNHVPIAQFEKEDRYPPDKVFQWLEKEGM